MVPRCDDCNGRRRTDLPGISMIMPTVSILITCFSSDSFTCTYVHFSIWTSTLQIFYIMRIMRILCLDDKNR